MISPNTLASRPTVRKWAPTPRQEETHKTGVWLCRLPAETLAPYAGQWLAAYDCEIVASAPTRGELAAKIAHLDRSMVIVHRVENRRMVR